LWIHQHENHTRRHVEVRGADASNRHGLPHPHYPQSTGKAKQGALTEYSSTGAGQPRSGRRRRDMQLFSSNRSLDPPSPPLRPRDATRRDGHERGRLVTPFGAQGRRSHPGAVRTAERRQSLTLCENMPLDPRGRLLTLTAGASSLAASAFSGRTTPFVYTPRFCFPDILARCRIRKEATAGVKRQRSSENSEEGTNERRKDA
jgi:hypothetical protein